MTTYSITTFRQHVDDLIAADSDELPQYRRERLIKSAMEEYSVDRPDLYTEDVTGDAGKYYPLTGDSASLTYFVDGFSYIKSIQYPAPTVASDEHPVYLEPDDWNDEYWAGGDRYLYLPRHAPASTEDMRIEYSRPYTWDVIGSEITVEQTAHGFSVDDYIYYDGEDWQLADDIRLGIAQVTTVTDADNFKYKILGTDPPESDFFAICHLAASKCCFAIATKYSRTSDSTIRADSVDHPSRAREFSDRAKEFLRRYREHVGIDKGYEKDYGIFGAFIDWDVDPSSEQQSHYIYH